MGKSPLSRWGHKSRSTDKKKKRISVLMISRVICMVARKNWGYLFNNDPEVVNIVASIMPYIALFQVRYPLLWSDSMTLGVEANFVDYGRSRMCRRSSPPIPRSPHYRSPDQPYLLLHYRTPLRSLALLYP